LLEGEPLRVACRRCPRSGEFVPGFEKPASWFGLFGPAALPAPVLARLHEEIVKSLKERDVSSKIDELAMSVIANTPEEFSAMIRAGDPSSTAG